MKRLFHTRLSRMTFLAFATSLIIVPAASASPIIDPVGQVPSAHPTIITPAKKKAPAKKQAAKWYRSSAPISDHGPVLP